MTLRINSHFNGSLTGLCVKGWAGPGWIIIGIGCKRYFTSFFTFLFDIIIIYIVELTPRAIKYNKKNYFLLKNGLKWVVFKRALICPGPLNTSNLLHQIVLCLIKCSIFFGYNFVKYVLLDSDAGLNSSIIGAFSGLCAFMGVAATFVSAALIRRLGILKVAAVSNFCLLSCII